MGITKEQQHQARLMAATFEINGEHKELRDLTVDEIGVALEQIADAIEQEAPELASVINDPDNDGGVIDELAGSLIFDIRDLADIYAYRESLRR